MAPISVPTVNNTSVRADRAPNQYQDASAATPDAFGAPVGRATQNFGAAVANGGDVFAEEARRQKNIDDTRNVLDAKTQLDDRIREFNYGKDGQGGELARQGVDALGGTKRTTEFYRGVTQELAGRFTDPQARLAFDKVAAAQRDSLLDATARREADARIQATTATAKAALESSKEMAVTSANDDKVAAAQLNIGIGAIRANPTGQPAEVVEQAVKSYRSDLQTSRILRVAVDSPAQAAEMYGRLKGEIAGADHIKIEKTLQPLRDRVEGVQIASEIAGLPGQRVQRLGVAAMSPISPVVGRANVASLATAVEGRESSGNPNAISPKGAAGLMQVMPDTARDISRRLGDGLISADTTDAQITELLKRPEVGAKYGVTYLHDMLQRYDGDIPAALVAYNAGPARADEWLKTRKSAGDLSGLPAETQAYVPKVMSRYADLEGGPPGTAGGEPNVFNQVRMGRLPPAGQKMTADNWSLKFYKPEDMLAPTPGGRQVDARAAMMADELGRQFYEATGVRVGINDTTPGPGTSGKRRGASDPADNPHVGNSRHLHGDAFDFQIQKLTPEQKRQFLTIARNIGFSGVGFYEGKSGHLHLDTGRARTWGSLPSWAGASIPALGASSAAVAPSINGLPTPAGWATAAGGGDGAARRAVAPGGPVTPSFLPPALSPEGRDLIGSPTPTAAPSGAPAAPEPLALPPAVRNAISLSDDIDADAIRNAIASDARLIERPAAMAAAKAQAERVIRSSEASRKDALKTLRAASIQHVQRGGATEDLDPDLYASLIEKDPKFVTDTLPAMEDRIRKRKDRTDAGEYYRILNMPEEQFADYDLSSSIAKLSQSDFEKLADRQAAARKENGQQAMRWNGIVERKAMADMALKSAGIFPERDDATANARAGVFYQRLDSAVQEFQTQNKRAMKPEELRETLNHLMTPVNAGDYTGKTQYLFEQGTVTENASRRRNELPLVGYSGQTFSAASSLEQIPAPALQTIVDNHAAARGEPPNPAQAMRIFNDALALETGRNPPVPQEARTEIIAGLRRRFGAAIQTDSSRSAELEQKIQDVYNRTLRMLTTRQERAAPPPTVEIPF